MVNNYSFMKFILKKICKSVTEDVKCNGHFFFALVGKNIIKSNALINKNRRRQKLIQIKRVIFINFNYFEIRTKNLKILENCTETKFH
jgi:hypothetical protein